MILAVEINDPQTPWIPTVGQGNRLKDMIL